MREEGRLGKNSRDKLGHLGTVAGGVVGGYRSHGYRLASWLRMWQGGSVSGWSGEPFRVILAGVVRRAHRERGGANHERVGWVFGATVRWPLDGAHDERTGGLGGGATRGVVRRAHHERGRAHHERGASPRTEDCLAGTGWTFEGSRMILRRG